MIRLGRSRAVGSGTTKEVDRLLDCDSRREVGLLLACARTSIDTAGAERIRRILEQEIDWRALLQAALDHRLIPLLYGSLSTVGQDRVPCDTLDLLRTQYLACARQTLFLTGELLKLLRLFDSSGIRAIPLKGPALAVAAYGNLSLRQFDDLDIFVSHQDILWAKEVLIKHGYRSKYQMTGLQEAAFIRSEYDYPFVSDDGEVLVELHTGVRPRYFACALDFERLWARREPVSLSGQPAWSLSPEDLFLSLCLHGSSHRWERLSWICDIAALVRTESRVDWPGLLSRARALGSERMLLLGLRLAHSLLETALPAEIVRKAQADRTGAALAGQVCRRLFQQEQASAGLMRTSLFHLRTRERWRDRARYFFRRAVTPTKGDYESMPLPPALAPLYFLFRPFRLAARMGRVH